VLNFAPLSCMGLDALAKIGILRPHSLHSLREGPHEASSIARN
jgi:hypothetical protein